MDNVTGAPGSSRSGCASGKNMGNQLCMSGVCVAGTVLMRTPLYSSASKYPANPCIVDGRTSAFSVNLMVRSRELSDELSLNSKDLVS